MTCIFENRAASRRLWLVFLGTTLALEAHDCHFWVADWLWRPLANFFRALLAFFWYQAGSREPWLVVLGTRLGLEAHDWHFWVSDWF